MKKKKKKKARPPKTFEGRGFGRKTTKNPVKLQEMAFIVSHETLSPKTTKSKETKQSQNQEGLGEVGPEANKPKPSPKKKLVINKCFFCELAEKFSETPPSLRKYYKNWHFRKP